MEFIRAKTIVSKTNGTEWFGTDYNMNIYKGCCHGCIYCDSRSECYRVEEFDRVRAKENALEIIRSDLRRRRHTGVVCTGAMSDPYNPLERQHRLTRGALELLNAYGFGVAVATKGSLVQRDGDILSEISTHSPVLVKITVTAASDGLSRLLEPNAPPSSERLAALKALAQRGLFAGVLLMPVLPFITDSDENILGVVRLAKEHGARFVYPSFGVTLRANQRDWYYDRLEERFAGQGLCRQYAALYGERYACGSPRAKHLAEVFSAECNRLGLYYRMKDIIVAYRSAYDGTQQSLFSSL